jgi:hypothetical protein
MSDPALPEPNEFWAAISEQFRSFQVALNQNADTSREFAASHTGWLLAHHALLLALFEALLKSNDSARSRKDLTDSATRYLAQSIKLHGAGGSEAIYREIAATHLGEFLSGFAVDSERLA